MMVLDNPEPDRWVLIDLQVVVWQWRPIIQPRNAARSYWSVLYLMFQEIFWKNVVQKRIVNMPDCRDGPTWKRELGNLVPDIIKKKIGPGAVPGSATFWQRNEARRYLSVLKSHQDFLNNMFQLFQQLPELRVGANLKMGTGWACAGQKIEKLAVLSWRIRWTEDRLANLGAELLVGSNYFSVIFNIENNFPVCLNVLLTWKPVLDNSEPDKRERNWPGNFPLN